MRNLFFTIAGAAAFGFIGYFAAVVFGACIGLVIAYWREGVFARIYYGAMVVVFSITIILLIGSTVDNILKGVHLDLPQVAIYGGFMAGIGCYLWAIYASWSRIQPESYLRKIHKFPKGRIHTLIDKSIFLLSWVSVAMLFVDLIFFAPKGGFLTNFTWLSECGVILFAIALALLAFRRVFLKLRHEPRWSDDRR